MKRYEYLRDAGWEDRQTGYDPNTDQFVEVWIHPKRHWLKGFTEKEALRIQMGVDIQKIGGLKRLRELAR